MNLKAYAATLCLLTGLAAERAAYRTAPPRSDQYHQMVASAAQMVPYRIGPWVGTDADVSAGAERLLKPNLLVARDFRNTETGQTLRLLLVHCRDARDLIGHYPPACYTGHGWDRVAAEPRDYEIQAAAVRAMRYVFSSTRLDRPERVVIDNFMVLPDGTTCRDMDGLHAAASAPRQRYLGAAQVQVLTDASLSDGQRDDLVRRFVAGSWGLIEVMSRAYVEQSS